MSTVDGATVIARSLREQGVEHMFGVLGVPVYPIARAAEREGIRFYAFRNEQAASYAAGAVGYLTGRPGVCLAVSGPGMIHAIAGLANAWANCWPMLLLGGANDSYQNGLGAFQEAPQIEAARPFVKYAARPDSAARMPFFIAQAFRHAMYGRPGAVYLDLPGDFISGQVESNLISYPKFTPSPERAPASQESVTRALKTLRTAERPLVIVGKGAAYSRAEDEIGRFLDMTQLPFLPTPMAKGMAPDDSLLSVSPARSYALQNADVIFLIGARLNWMLHFGAEPRFAPNVRVIHLELSPEEIGNNGPVDVALLGDAKVVMAQLIAAIKTEPWEYPSETAWRSELSAKIEQNQKAVAAMCSDDSVPMGYYRALKEIAEQLPRESMLVTEGSNTMDIARTVLPSFLPRHRLDAGTFGAMGVGLGFAIASAVLNPQQRTFAVEGDSAFGFSGMEVEVACRFNLPITFIILNNDQGGGQAYVPNARYEKIIEVFGGTGYYAKTPGELRDALRAAATDSTPNIINVQIDPKAQRKAQQFNWLTR